MENTAEVNDGGCSPVKHREWAEVHRPCLSMIAVIEVKRMTHLASGCLQLCLIVNTFLDRRQTMKKAFMHMGGLCESKSAEGGSKQIGVAS